MATSNKQLTGMRGVYLVAAELSKHGLLASPTSRSAIGADILVTDQACSRAYSVQVKTNAKSFGFWLLNEKALTTVARTHIYVLVNLRPLRDGERIEYFVVPSSVVARKMVSEGNWRQINLADVRRYRDNWGAFNREK